MAYDDVPRQVLRDTLTELRKVKQERTALLVVAESVLLLDNIRYEAVTKTGHVVPCLFCSHPISLGHASDCPVAQAMQALASVGAGEE